LAGPERAASLSPAEARRIALRAQGFATARTEATSPWPRVAAAIGRMGLLQLDSVSVLARAHYLPVFSRLGAYDRAALDARAFGPRRRALFEYWGHEASLMPLALHPLLRWRMARAERLEGVWGEVATLARERPGHIARVLAEVAARGPLSARDLGGDGGGGGMWSWHDGKRALEYLFWSGRLAAAGRRGFERLYELSERALPAAVLAAPTPDEATAQRRLLAIAAAALGIATEADLRDYFRLPAAAARARLAELVEAGEVRPVTVAGWRQPAYRHGTAADARPVRAAALISPFDPLVWARGRTERLFGFRYRLEIYTPAADRRHGYYVLPFLLGEKLVARVDLKADRAAHRLVVRGAFAEAGVRQARVAAALAAELGRLARWLGLDGIAVARRGDLAPSLAAARPAP